MTIKNPNEKRVDDLREFFFKQRGYWDEYPRKGEILRATTIDHRITLKKSGKIVISYQHCMDPKDYEALCDLVEEWNKAEETFEGFF